MKILLTGATGYIGERLLTVLLQQGHEVVCAVRDSGRVDLKKFKPEQVKLIDCDLLGNKSLKKLPLDNDMAYYLVHSMTGKDFEEQEKKSAEILLNTWIQPKPANRCILAVSSTARCYRRIFPPGNRLRRSSASARFR